MIISRVIIRAFKSIFELSLPVDPKVTVLIGANESGKTNILKAIESFKPHSGFNNNLTCQYSDYYYQGKCPEITIEYCQLSRENRRSLMPISEVFKDLESFSIRRVGPDLGDYQVFQKNEEIQIRNIKVLLERLPKILYFDNISLIKNRVELDSLLNGDKGYSTERNLLKIGGLQNNFELIFEDSTRGRRASEEAGKLITQQIRRVWSQEPTIEIKLNVNGKVLYIDISDGTTVYDTPESRSLGFRWYLSFYINFIAQTFEAKANEFIFLLDEPGIHLHPAGQKDLTKVMEDLSIKNQLVYTTHSPFMINREYPQRVRLVSKGREGTKVDAQAYRDNWKPLRRSIGLMLGDLFFFNDSSLIVEVPSQKIPLVKKFHFFKSRVQQNN
jgi:predicted ATP-dependent endonuclease of OLD family